MEVLVWVWLLDLIPNWLGIREEDVGRRLLLLPFALVLVMGDKDVRLISLGSPETGPATSLSTGILWRPERRVNIVWVWVGPG